MIQYDIRKVERGSKKVFFFLGIISRARPVVKKGKGDQEPM